MFVLGTRPEVIKLAPVIFRIREHTNLATTICSTGQHREMVSQAFEAFGLAPDIDLGVMRPDQSLAQLTAAATAALDDVFAADRPSVVVVQGDTTTAMTGALCAYYRRIPIAHVEAGLRTSDKHSPFPEEINRRLIGSVADLHFAPTDAARANLIKEGVPERDIWVTGNTAVDALLMMVAREPAGPLLVGSMNGAVLDADDIGSKRLVLVTAHRRENHDEGIASICEAIKSIASLPDALIVFAVHLNPNVRNAVLPSLQGLPNVWLTEPLDYVTFCRLMAKAWLVMTDSGGIQEEAPSLGLPVFVLRDATERPEGIAAGNARLTGPGSDRITSAVRELWDDAAMYDRMASAPNPYGDGKAAERIAAAIAGRI